MASRNTQLFCSNRERHALKTTPKICLHTFAFKRNDERAASRCRCWPKIKTEYSRQAAATTAMANERVRALSDKPLLPPPPPPPPPPLLLTAGGGFETSNGRPHGAGGSDGHLHLSRARAESASARSRCPLAAASRAETRRLAAKPLKTASENMRAHDFCAARKADAKASKNAYERSRARAAL